MDMEELARLKELARKVTLGPWSLFENKSCLVTGMNRRLICSCRHESFNRPSLNDMASNADNAAYIAAAHPAMILEMIEQLMSLYNKQHDFCDKALEKYNG